MKLYFKNGTKVRISRETANKISKVMMMDDIKDQVIREYMKDTGKFLFAVRIDEIVMIK